MTQTPGTGKGMGPAGTREETSPLTDADEGAGLDPQDAAAILQQAQDRARSELGVKRPLILAAGGLAYVLGYGAIWLSVRGQHPYQGPTGPATAVAIVLVGFAVAITAAVLNRAVSGVGGVSGRQRAASIAALVVGYAGIYTLEAALDHAGASRPVVFGVFAAAAPVMMIGAVYIANSAARLDWPLFTLGAWLVVTAAASAFAGPVGVWGVGALAGGGGFLLVAALHDRLRRL